MAFIRAQSSGGALNPLTLRVSLGTGGKGTYSLVIFKNIWDEYRTFTLSKPATLYVDDVSKGSKAKDTAFNIADYPCTTKVHFNVAHATELTKASTLDVVLNK